MATNPKTPVAELSLSNMPYLDLGRIDAGLAKTLSPLINDCVDRPHEKGARKANMQFNLTPVLEDDGSCRDVNVEVTMKGAAPQYVSKTYTMRAKRKPGPDNEWVLLFNRDSADIDPRGHRTLIDQIHDNAEPMKGDDAE